MLPRRASRPRLTGLLLAALVAVVVPLAGASAVDTGPGSYQAPRLVHGGTVTADMSRARVSTLVLGGVTSQDWPVVIEMSRNGKTVTRAVAGINASTEEYMLLLPDWYKSLRVKRGRFGMDWIAPQVDFGNGYSADCSGSIRGKFSADRGKVSGTWTYRAVVKDPAGTVVATHDTGTLTWSARQ
jgi:hypothetical protein